MPGSGPSPKRRRTDNGPATAEEVAQTNATVHMFMGHRQNRWLQGANAGNANVNGAGSGTRQTDGDEVGRNSINTTAAQQNNTASSSASRQSAPIVPSNRNPQPPASRSNIPSTAGGMAANGNAGSASLVDYDSPDAVPSRPANTTGQSGRKSLDAQAGTATRQGLPSPAPSEDNGTHSPINEAAATIPAAPPRRGPGRPPKDYQPRRTSTSGTPSMIQTQAAFAAPQAPGSRFAPPPIQQRVPSTTTPAMRHSPRIQTQATVPSPLQRQHPSPITPTLPSNVPPTFQPPSGHGHQRYSNGQSIQFVPPAGQPLAQIQPALPQQHFYNFFNHRFLIQTIDAQQQRITAADPTDQTFRNDSGRLSLLKDAVQQGDSFYLVLSQLYSLKTVASTTLPQQINAVPDVSWRQLENLLCSNDTLLRGNLEWFSNFPAPIMSFYSTNIAALKTTYETQVTAVAESLHKLPGEWPKMAWESNQREAPPLVQDMVERLGLYSPVLRVVAFRAIARTFWTKTNSPNVEKGLESLERLYYADANLFQQGYKRSPQQKVIAYSALQTLLQQWKAHDVAQQYALQQQAGGNATQLMPVFQIPNSILQIFGLGTPMVQTPPTQQSQLQTRPGLQPQPQPQPVTWTQQQQMAMMQNAQSLAQQQAWLRQNVGNGAMSPGAGAASTGQPRPGHYIPPPTLPGMGRRLVFPTDRDCPRPQPTHPDSTKSALHQAHLRSPILVAAEIEGRRPKLYRQVENCPLSPTRILPDRPVQKMTFVLAPAFQDHIPKAMASSPGAPPVELLAENSHQYRLRCCRIDNTSGFPTLSSWLEADNVWPEAVYFELNGSPLEPRKKLHHSRYLPMDMTHLVCAGPNELKLYLNRSSRDTSPFDYAIAVELVNVKSHDSILTNLRTITAEESLESIKASLSTPASGNSSSNSDDDLLMISSTCTIKLFDPISGSRIFSTPVRGQGCLHRDPFDLEIFLSQLKRPSADAPSVVDMWRCPICRKDVRPQTLVRDGFLVKVREELRVKGLLETRAIVVDAEGVWKGKVEERTGVRSASLEREERDRLSTAAAAVGRGVRPPPVVIELD